MVLFVLLCRTVSPRIGGKERRGAGGGSGGGSGGGGSDLDRREECVHLAGGILLNGGAPNLRDLTAELEDIAEEVIGVSHSRGVLLLPHLQPDRRSFSEGGRRSRRESEREW